MVWKIIKATLGVYAALFAIVLLGINGGSRIVSPNVTVTVFYFIMLLWWVVPLIVAPICLSVDWFRLKRSV